MQIGHQALDEILCSFNIQLDSPVVQIARTTDKFPLRRHPGRKRAIPHTLHSPAHQDVRSNSGCRPAIRHAGLEHSS